MAFFPPLVRDDTIWLLPCTEAAAAALAQGWLEPASPAAAHQLRRALGSDPPLALWVAAQAPDDDRPPGETWPGWLADTGLARFADPWASESGGGALGLIPRACGEFAEIGPAADEAWRATQVADDAARARSIALPEALDPRALAALCASADIWLTRYRYAGSGGSAEFWAGRRPPGGPHNAYNGAMNGNGAARPAVDPLAPFTAERPPRVATQAALPENPDVGGWLTALARHVRLARRDADERAAALHREKLASLAEFAAGAGHEMNNPLAVISGRAQLLLAGERDPARRRDLAAIQQQAGRVHEMIADLMLFARPPAPRKEPCDLAVLVERVARELGPSAAERGIQLETRLEARLGPAWVDPNQLIVALRALVENALRAVPRAGRITIRLRMAPSPAVGAELVVADNGPGLAPLVRRHLFDPYFSGYPAGRGLGLGLSKAWRIARLHGGDLTVAPESEPGATFVLSLPATAFSEPPGAEPRAPGP